MKKFLFFFVTLLIYSGRSYSATINVPADYSTIQAAVAAAANGDVIVVAAGTHTVGSQISITLSNLTPVPDTWNNVLFPFKVTALFTLTTAAKT